MPGSRIVEGEAVSLRTVEPEDASFIQRAYTDPRVRTGLGSPHPPGRSHLEEAIESAGDADGELYLLVTIDEADADPGHPDDDAVMPIGSIHVSEADWKRPDLAYWLVPEHHDKGYGTEAVSLAIDYVFETIDVPAIGAEVYEFNEPSRRLLTALGFTEEGRLRKHRFVDGRHVDTIVYGLLRSEWRDE